MRHREVDSQLGHARQHLLRQPAGKQEVELPAELGAALFQPVDARHQALAESRFRRMHRRDVDAHAPHPESMQPRELGVAFVLVDIDDAAAGMPDRPHRIEHAGVVARIRARLHEDDALETVLLSPFEVLLERRERRLVAQLRIARRVALRRTEDVEVRVASAFHAIFLNPPVILWRIVAG